MTNDQKMNSPTVEKSGSDKAPRKVASHDLFKESSKMIIEHQGDNYTLQITRNGKLILTK